MCGSIGEWTFLTSGYLFSHAEAAPLVTECYFLCRSPVATTEGNADFTKPFQTKDSSCYWAASVMWRVWNVCTHTHVSSEQLAALTIMLWGVAPQLHGEIHVYMHTPVSNPQEFDECCLILSTPMYGHATIQQVMFVSLSVSVSAHWPPPLLRSIDVSVRSLMCVCLWIQLHLPFAHPQHTHMQTHKCVCVHTVLLLHSHLCNCLQWATSM